MSRNDEFNDEYEDDEFDEQQNAPKDLRRALSKANKEKADLAKQVSDLMAQVKTQTLASLMSEKKIPAKIQRWIKRDEVEPTAEAVDKWLAENGEDFGYNPEGQTEEPKPATTQEPAPVQSVLTPDEAQEMGRFQNMGQAPSTPMAIDPAKAAVDQVAANITLNTDFNAVAEMLKAAGIPVEGQY